MNDVIYAGFAQLSYLNWHKLDNKSSGLKLSSIFGKDTKIFTQIKTSDYNVMQTDGKDYYVKKENNKKIYDRKDARIFYLYSENEKEPGKNPMHPEFGEWEFVCAYDHKKIFNEMLKNTPKNIEITKSDSGFQACAFKKGNDVIISYRGSDSLNVYEHFLGDWYYTNGNLGFLGAVPDSLTCAIWFYEKIKLLLTPSLLVDVNYKSSIKKLETVKFHITGHSMGGALAQYVAVYSNGQHKTVTWNSLGIGDKSKLVVNKDKFKHYLTFAKNYPSPWENQHIINSIINYYFSQDLTANLQKRVGKIICVDKKSNIKNDYLGSSKIREILMMLSKDFGEYHAVSNFLPFFKNKNIEPEFLSETYIKNSNKSVILEFDYLKNDLKTLKKDKYEILKSIRNLDSKGRNKPITLFYYVTDKKTNEYKDNWYKRTSTYVEIGKFNNTNSIAGAVGGKPLKFTLLGSTGKTQKIYKIKSNGKVVIFKDLD